MREHNGMQFTEKEWRHIKARFIKFYQEENECTGKCPMGWDEYGYETIINEQIDDKLDSAGTNKCLCLGFPEFNKCKKAAQNGDRMCPCDVYGEKAFVQLEKLVTRWKTEDA